MRNCQLTSDPVVVTHQGEQALAAAHVPHPDALVSAPAGQEGTRVGATEMMTSANPLNVDWHRPIFVVSSCCVPCGLVDGRSGDLWCPGHALHHVIVVPHLYLDILTWKKDENITMRIGCSLVIPPACHTLTVWSLLQLANRFPSRDTLTIRTHSLKQDVCKTSWK